MRGTVIVWGDFDVSARITPAHAGNRYIEFGMRSTAKDHPRTCGEQEGEDSPDRNDVGSPPHMRGTAL